MFLLAAPPPRDVMVSEPKRSPVAMLMAHPQRGRLTWQGEIPYEWTFKWENHGKMWEIPYKMAVSMGISSL